MDDIHRAFARDHQRILSLLDTAARALGDADSDAGVEPTALTGLARSLRLHMAVEEQVLFPLVERLVGAPVVSTLRREHDVLRKMLVEVDASFQRREWRAAELNLRELEAAIRLHDAREESAIYPLVDRVLDAASITALAALLESGAAP